MVDARIKMAKVSNKASVSVCTSNQYEPKGQASDSSTFKKKFLFCPDLHDVTKRGYHQRRHDNSTFS